MARIPWLAISAAAPFPVQMEFLVETGGQGRKSACCCGRRRDKARAKRSLRSAGHWTCLRRRRPKSECDPILQDLDARLIAHLDGLYSGETRVINNGQFICVRSPE